MAATAEDVMVGFLEEGHHFLKTWENAILNFDPAGGARRAVTLHQAIHRLREACHAAGYHEFGVLVRIVEAMTLDIQRGQIRINNETRNLLIDFHGITERWIRSLQVPGGKAETPAESLSRMIARSLRLRKPLLERKAWVGEAGSTQDLWALRREGSPSSVLNGDQDARISCQEILTLDHELTGIWTHLVTLEENLKGHALSQEAANTLGQLRASVRFTKEKLLALKDVPNHTLLCEVLIVQSGGLPVAVPVIDLIHVLHLRDHYFGAEIPGEPSERAPVLVTFEKKHYPLRALAKILDPSSQTSEADSLNNFALLANLARGPGALSVERILCQKTVLVRLIEDARGSLAPTKGWTTFENKSCMVISTKQII